MGGPAIINGKKYKEFDNFYPSGFYIENHFWCCSEQYYQSRKCLEVEYQSRIQSCLNANMSWKLGQECALRSDWEEVKVNVMFRANLAKFSQNNELWKLLVNTGNNIIVLTNSTTFWNENNGKVLEEIREILRRHSNVVH